MEPLPYIVSRNPLKYGGYQDDYQKRKQELILWGARQIKECPQDEKSLVQLFFRLFEKFCNERNNIANDHKSFEANYFGVRRDKEGYQPIYLTILDKEYDEYNTKMLNYLAVFFARNGY